jgi:putative nucleotidyltransferase with HDIG domain
MSRTLSTDACKRLREMNSIPAVPALLLPALEFVKQSSEEVDMNRAVQLASRDQAVAALCLRMVNSPLFSVGRQITSLREALVLMGLRRFQNIVVSICLSKLLPRDKYIVDPTEFWKHAFAVATLTQKLSQLVGYGQLDKCYLAGLVHDIGCLANATCFPKPFRAALEKATSEAAPLDISENAVMSFSHSDSGGYLAEIWQFPDEVIDAIRWHHNMHEAASRESAPLVALVNLADVFCRVRGMGYGYPERLRVDFTTEPAWRILTERYKSLADVDLARFTFEVDECVDEISRLVAMIFPPVAS